VGNEIEQVIAELEQIVQTCRARENRAGYFAAMYLAVTREIKVAVDAGRFQDGPRMEKLDQVFAGRYIDAFYTNQAGGAPTESWAVSFEAARRWRPIIIQQLLIGMNAHINLDLGIAAAEVAPGDQIDSLRSDFDTINDVLSSMTKRFTQNVAAVSPWIKLLDRIGGKPEQEIIRFSIDIARDEAWELATELAPLPADAWPEKIAARDRTTAELGRFVWKPGMFLSAGLFVIRARESNDVVTVIDTLGAMSTAT